jgi:uncharacterized membrane-anchored protein
MNNKKNILKGLIFVAFLQVSILIGEYVVAEIPIWTGKEITIKTLPIDPRSMFRGQYVRLNYYISHIDGVKLTKKGNFRHGEVIYTSLKKGDDGHYAYSGISFKKPKEGIFLKGRLGQKRHEDEINYYHIKYGIEALFLPKEKAIAMEKDLAKSGIAVLRVSESGKARLIDVIGNNKEIR